MYEKWKNRYDNGWVIEYQLQRLVVLGVLTQAQYEDITGETYPA